MGREQGDCIVERNEKLYRNEEFLGPELDLSSWNARLELLPKGKNCGANNAYVKKRVLSLRGAFCTTILIIQN